MQEVSSNTFTPPHPLKTAVLFLIFKRPDTTKQVFEAIRKAKPPRFYVAADGPRVDEPGEEEKVEQVRRIATQVDWDCAVKILFRDKNLGCKIAVSSAIDWFFENEEEGIILEDDCLPSQSFFWFCETLLERYKDDNRIMHIAGMTYVPSKDYSYSYHFVRVGGIWGWASWRRAWQLYELDMESWPYAQEENTIDDLFIGEKEAQKIYESWFKIAYQNDFTWDYQWTYTKVINNSINIMPAKNLVVNLGHGSEEATHTHLKDDRYLNMKLDEIGLPLKHPRFIVIDRGFTYDNLKYITKQHFINKMVRIARTVVPSKLTSLLRCQLFSKRKRPFVFK